MRGFWVLVNIVVSLRDARDGLVGGNLSSNCDMVDFDVDSEPRGCLRRERNCIG